jgi:hypothetical protein
MTAMQAFLNDFATLLNNPMNVFLTGVVLFAVVYALVRPVKEYRVRAMQDRIDAGGAILIPNFRLRARSRGPLF